MLFLVATRQSGLPCELVTSSEDPAAVVRAAEPEHRFTGTTEDVP